ncbi:MAG: CpaD family pilus assembly lipoprotein [Pseudomonadales bacterium]
MKRIIALGAVVLLAGCQQINQLPYVQAQSATPSQHLKVVPVSYQFDINLGTGSLVTEDRVAIERFLRSHGPIDNQRLVVVADKSRQRQLSQWLASAGVKGNHLRWQTQGSRRELVVLITEYFKVRTPDCPNWQGNPSGHASSQQRSSNFGCATAANLAVMVRDPRELLKGRSLGAVNSDKMLSAVESYVNPPTADQGATTSDNQTISQILGGQQ